MKIKIKRTKGDFMSYPLWVARKTRNDNSVQEFAATTLRDLVALIRINLKEEGDYALPH